MIKDILCIRAYINITENETNSLHVMRNSPRFACLSQSSGIISRNNSPSDFLFSFTGREGEDTPGFGRSPHPHPRQVTALLYRAREATTTARSRGYLVLCSRFPVHLTRDPLHTGSLLPSPRVRNDCGRRLPHPERPGYRTNGEFDDPNGGSERARAPPDTTRYSNADLGSRLGRGSSRADRHSRYPSCRGIPRFVNIPPNRSFRRREPSRCGPADCTWP